MSRTIILIPISGVGLTSVSLGLIQASGARAKLAL